MYLPRNNIHFIFLIWYKIIAICSIYFIESFSKQRISTYKKKTFSYLDTFGSLKIETVFLHSCRRFRRWSSFALTSHHFLLRRIGHMIYTHRIGDFAVLEFLVVFFYSKLWWSINLTTLLILVVIVVAFIEFLLK